MHPENRYIRMDYQMEDILIQKDPPQKNSLK